MKPIVSGGGGGFGIPTESEAEVAEILLSLPKILAKSELIKRFSFSWGLKKKRSVLVSKSESEKSAVMEAGKSPSTPLCFGSGSDGGDKGKPPTSVKRNLKRKATDKLVETYNRVQQENEILLRETKALKTLHQELTSANLGLKSILQKVKYSRTNYHPQMTMFLTSTPQLAQLVAMPCSSNSHSGGRFGLFNQMDPRVKIHGETCEFLVPSQPLDQNKYLMMDDDLRARNAAAAAARKRRMLRMKENNEVLVPSQPLDQNKYLMTDDDLRARNAAAAARKRRMLRMKENKNALLSMKVSRR